MHVETNAYVNECEYVAVIVVFFRSILMCSSGINSHQHRHRVALQPAGFGSAYIRYVSDALGEADRRPLKSIELSASRICDELHF